MSAAERPARPIGSERSAVSRAQSRKQRQVGHDTGGRKAEDEVHLTLQDRFELWGCDIGKQPKGHFMKSIYGKNHGMKFDLVGLNPDTGKEIFIEVKTQGSRGNAHERAYKHHTPMFQKKLQELTGWDRHPVITVFCGNLATDQRYINEFKVMLEPENYVLASSGDALISFFDRLWLPLLAQR